MNNKPNYKKGTRREILKLIHIGSILPTRALNVMDTPRTFKDKLREMESEGVLAKNKVVNNKRTYKFYTLNNYETTRACYSDSLPNGYYETYVEYGLYAVKDCKNKEGTASMRIMTTAETLVLMSSAKISCLPDEKPMLKGKDFIDSGANYYLSREIKNYTGYKDSYSKEKFKGKNGEEMKLVVSSRLTGLLVSDGGIYAVYNVGRSIQNWQRGGELKIKTHIDFMLGEKMKDPSNCEAALLYAENFDSFSAIFNPASPADHKAVSSFDNLSSVYRRVYVLPYSKDGRKMTEIMAREGWADSMKGTLLKGFTTERVEEQGIACDAYTDDESVLLFCIPDLAKLQKFLAAAEYDGHREKFIVICFDFQASLVARACAGKCRIMKAPFERYYREYMEGNS